MAPASRPPLGPGLAERGQGCGGTRSRGSGMTAAAALPPGAQIVSTAACSPAGSRSRPISAASPLAAVTGGPGAYDGAPVRRSRSPTCRGQPGDRKSTRLNSSHVEISYAVFCLKKKKKNDQHHHKIKKKKRVQ